LTRIQDKALILGAIRNLSVDGQGFDGFNQLLRGVTRAWLTEIKVQELRLRKFRTASSETVASWGVSEQRTGYIQNGRRDDAFLTAAATSRRADSGAAAEEALAEVQRQMAPMYAFGERVSPTVLIVQCTCNHDLSDIAQRLQSICKQDFPNGPDVMVHGGTSISGVMAAGAVVGGPADMRANTDHALALFCIHDPRGVYATAHAPSCSRDTVAAACRTAAAAPHVQKRTICHPPRLVNVCPAPGNEESLLSGISDGLGHGVPVFGGSSADQDLSGQWKQLSGVQVHSSGVAMLLMWPSVETYVRLSTLHRATSSRGIVTAVQHEEPPKVHEEVEVQTALGGGQVSPAVRLRPVMQKNPLQRTVLTIDGRPAAQVYDEWTGGMVGRELAEAQAQPQGDGAGGKEVVAEVEALVGNVLAQSTNFPLAQLHKQNAASTSCGQYPSLIHPAMMLPNGGLQMFAAVREGTELTCMEAPTQQLVESVPAVMQSCLRDSGFVTTGAVPAGEGQGGPKLHGALIIYCGGMMLRVGTRMGEVADHIGTAIQNEIGAAKCPWVGHFTFGEQGPAEAEGIMTQAQAGAQAGGASSAAEKIAFKNVHGNLMFNCLLFGERC